MSDSPYEVEGRSPSDDLCPDCGKSLPAEGMVCTNCGLNLETGQRVSEPPRIDESSLKCVQCGYNLTGIAIGGVCPECGESVETSMRSFPRGGIHSGIPLPKVSLVGPILITIFCCLIGGIITIVYTAKANTAAVQGDEFNYHSAIKARNGWMVASIIIGLVGGLAQIAVVAANP